MKIALVGATGNVGTRLISELARRGHYATAIARHPEKLQGRACVSPVSGDVQNEDALAAVLAGHDVVIHSVKFLSTNASKIIAATKAAKVPRLLVVGGAGSLEVSPGLTLVNTPDFHAYDNSENVLKTIGSGRLTARPPSPEILEQIVEDSMSGSHEATMAYPMESILEDISAEVANINVPTVVLAGELDQVDSIERHKTEVLAYLPNAEFKIIKGSGHLTPIDEPHELAKEIASFMGGLLHSRNNA